jgi:eukaryotic-like serine/threonine-protein kinase
MRWLSDDVVGRLQSAVQLPELAGTRYRAIQFLGRGGMSTVWLAEDALLQRRVALKILALENSSAALASRLMQEALVLARLEHPGIVPVHDAGTLADGRTFYCMKYVEGQTLDRHIAGRSLRERLYLLQRIAEPLAFAHARGIVHRDLKPGNIMIGPFGEVLIMDWGLAKIVGPSASDSALAALSGPEAQASPASGLKSTEHGSVLGTPGYMAPEQARGEIGLIDQRTDVFALGAILRFMLRDASPRETSSPKPLVAICRKAMAEEMAERYESARDFAADIGRYLEEERVSVYRESMLERARRFGARHQAAIVLIVAYLMMRLLFILFSRR